MHGALTYQLVPVEAHFGRCDQYYLPPEVASDVISDIAVEDVGLGILSFEYVLILGQTVLELFPSLTSRRISNYVYAVRDPWRTKRQENHTNCGTCKVADESDNHIERNA